MVTGGRGENNGGLDVCIQVGFLADVEPPAQSAADIPRF